MPDWSQVYGTSTVEEMEEEVIFSEGEPLEGNLYPDSTWDSDDTLYEEDHSSRSEWI